MFDRLVLYFQLLANIVKREYVPIKDLVEILIEWSGEDLFPTHTVGELLWGYDDPLINKTITLLESLMKKKFSISDKFGIFVGVGIDSVDKFACVKFSYTRYSSRESSTI